MVNTVVVSFSFLVTPPQDDPNNKFGPFEQSSFLRGTKGLADVFRQLSPYIPEKFYYGGPQVTHDRTGGGDLEKQRRAIIARTLRGRLPSHKETMPPSFYQLPPIGDAADYYQRLQEFFCRFSQTDIHSPPVVIVEHPWRVVNFLQNVGQKCDQTLGPLSHEANSLSLVGFDHSAQNFFLPDLALLTYTGYLDDPPSAAVLAAKLLSIFAPVSAPSA